MTPAYEDLDDRDLLVRAQTDSDAFAVLYRRHAPGLTAYFTREVGRADLAGDLTSETFAAALRALPDYRPTAAPGRSWLYAIGHHRLVDTVRRGRSEARAREALENQAIALHAGDDAQADRVIAALDGRSALALVGQLPEEQRRAIAARYLADRDYAEIAAELDTSEQVIRKRVSRGLSTLRLRLGGHGFPVVALGGLAAAAIVVVVTLPSAPLKGALPAGLPGAHYTLAVAPDLSAGRNGWCVQVVDSTARGRATPLIGNCVAASGGPMVSSGGQITLSQKTGHATAWMLYALVRSPVATVRRPDGRRITPIASSALPPGMRAVVTLERDPGVRPGATVELFPLNAHGTSLSARYAGPSTRPTVALRGAGTATSGCSVSASRSAGGELSDMRALAGPAPSRSSASGYLSCFSAQITGGDSAGRVAVLLNAADADRPAAVLPGSRRVRGSSTVRVSPAAFSVGVDPTMRRWDYSRRVGHGLLVLETAAAPSAAVQALEALQARA